MIESNTETKYQFCFYFNLFFTRIEHKTLRMHAFHDFISWSNIHKYFPFIYFFGLIHEVSWGGPQLWEAPLSPYHNLDQKSPLEPGDTGSPNKGDFPATRIGEQTQSSHLKGLHCQWSQHFVGSYIVIISKAKYNSFI